MPYGLMYFTGLIQTFRFKNNKYFTYLFTCMLIFFASIRVNIGTDYEAYLRMYYQMPNNIELGYRLLNLISRKMDMGVNFVFLISSIIIIFNIVKAAKKSETDITLFIFLYFCLYYFSHNYNVLRHGIAASFILVSIVEAKNSNYKNMILNLIFGYLFHRVTLAVAPFLLISKLKINKLTYIYITLISLLFYFNDFFLFIISLINKYFSESIIMYKIDYYQTGFFLDYDISKTAFGFPLGFYLKIIIFLLCVITPEVYKNRKYEINIYFYAIVSTIVFNDLYVFVHRFASILYMVDMILIIELSNRLFKSKRGRYLKFMLIVAYGTYFLVQVLTIREIYGNFQYLPYESIIGL